MDCQYTNQLLATMDQPPFPAEELAGMGDEACALIAGPVAFCRQNPVTAIYRLTTVGCRRTRRDGIGNKYNPEQAEGLKIRLENEQLASVLTEGSIVTYPDGSKAKIIRCAGSEYSIDAKGIISTPQDGSVLVGREGDAIPSDFLSIVEGA